MYVESLSLANFRNYESLEISFDPGVNLFYGDNAQGKTNILEAVYLAGTTKSHRGSKEKTLVRIGEDESHIRMVVRKKENDCRIDMHLRKNRPKGVAIGGFPIRRASELYGIVSLVFFSPEDLNIIKNGPAERRHFIDTELSQLDKIYLEDLVRYTRSLNQRNKLLHEGAFRTVTDLELAVWEEQLVEYGSRIAEKRAEFLETISGITAGIHSRITGGRETMSLTYEPSAVRSNFAERLALAKENDLRMMVTSVGPHRDDFAVIVDGLDARQFASQGQQKTAALSLKLSEIELVKRTIRDTPVLLLDDVLSELDSDRQKYLLHSIRDTQTLITCTGIGDLTEHQFSVDKTFHVVAGGIA